MEHQLEYNKLNSIRHTCVQKAEDKCRKLVMGQVDFSPSIQMARTKIYAWTLLLRCAEEKQQAPDSLLEF
jgi:capsule polysaccharide export protein KpsC/LpsZ